MKCGGGISIFYFVYSGVWQGCVLVPPLFNTCMDWILSKVVVQRRFRVFVGEIKVTDFVFADDPVLLIELIEVLVMSSHLEACQMTQFSLFMHVVRTSRSLKLA